MCYSTGGKHTDVVEQTTYVGGAEEIKLANFRCVYGLGASIIGVVVVVAVAAVSVVSVVAVAVAVVVELGQLLS